MKLLKQDKKSDFLFYSNKIKVYYLCLVMRDTNLGNEPEPVTRFLDGYSVNEPFDTSMERVNVQSLGMSVHPLEHGRGSYEYELLDGMDGSVAIYDPPVEFSSVLMFETGWGYYCCQSIQDVEEIESWFEDNLEDYRQEEIQLIDLSD